MVIALTASIFGRSKLFDCRHCHEPNLPGTCGMAVDAHPVSVRLSCGCSDSAAASSACGAGLCRKQSFSRIGGRQAHCGGIGRARRRIPVARRHRPPGKRRAASRWQTFNSGLFLDTRTSGKARRTLLAARRRLPRVQGVPEPCRVRPRTAALRASAACLPGQMAHVPA